MADTSVLMIDTCSDLPADLVDGLGVTVVNFPYAIDGTEHLDDFGRTMSHAEFYDAMRAGEHPTTMQVPRHVFLDTFRTHAQAGTPLMYLGFSSALSGTFDIAWTAREEVLTEFPDAEIRIVDTRAASIAEGLLVYEAARRWQDGMALADLEAWVERARPRLHGWFIIDDLDTLVRGGRLSGTAAAAGTLLDVKPLLQVTADGRLEVARRLRGRAKSMRALADIVAQHAADGEWGTVAIGHGDCAEDARRLAGMLAERAGVDEVITMPVGPVIGTHTGPGMLAVSFWGEG